MSPSKTRRKFGSIKSGQKFLNLANILAKALQSDFGGLRSAVKHIAQITHAHPDTVSNWYQEKSAPNSEYLILLAQSSPSLARVIVDLISHTQHGLSSVPFQGNSEKQAPASLRHHNAEFPDQDVTVNVTINLNSRQNWFMVQLSQGHEIRPAHITEHWHVSLRTAKRDLSDLVAKGMVTYLGHPKRGRYMVLPTGNRPSGTELNRMPQGLIP